MDIKKYIIDYIEGRVQPEEFNNRCESDSRIFEWIQTIVPENETYPYHIEQYMEDGKMKTQVTYGHFQIEKVYKIYMNSPGRTRLAKNLNLHGLIYRLVKNAFPNEALSYDETLGNRFDYLLDVRPTYIGGEKADTLIEKIIEENPKSSKKDVKVKIKQAFHIEGNKYPRWAQEPEWPFSDIGKPMKYISQKRINSEVIELTFEDVDTGERKVVTDIY